MCMMAAVTNAIRMVAGERVASGLWEAEMAYHENIKLEKNRPVRICDMKDISNIVLNSVRIVTLDNVRANCRVADPGMDFVV